MFGIPLPCIAWSDKDEQQSSTTTTTTPTTADPTVLIIKTYMFKLGSLSSGRIYWIQAFVRVLDRWWKTSSGTDVSKEQEQEQEE